MYFLDNSGHIFLEQDFKELPIGHEYNEHDNIFWIKSNNQYKLSVNNYYGRTINMLIPIDVNNISDIDYDNVDLNITIECDSNIFHLISASKFDINEDGDIFGLNNDSEKLDITSSIKYNKQILTSDNDNDILAIFIEDDNVDNVHKNFALVPIYVIGKSDISGTWITNLLIHVEYSYNKELISDRYASISVGMECHEESEILEINANNFGIKLPKDIIYAIYDTSLENEVFDEVVWNRKLKEYLLNYMDIKGQNGNFNSAIKSLQWFGYGDKINISKLLKTDNDVKNQYIRDYFDIYCDILSTFNIFKNQTLISIFINGNEELKDENGNIIYTPQEFNKFLWGEEKPIMINLFKSNKFANIGLGNTEKWKYIESYFKYSFNELGLKLACLNYYYKKYFLPLHINIHSSSIQFKTYMDDIKFTCYSNTYKTEQSVLIRDKRQTNDIIFPSYNIHWFNKQIHIVDKYLNEYDKSYVDMFSENEDMYYIHETCANIPIKFTTKNKLYNCVFLLEEINNDNYYECFINETFGLNDNLRCLVDNEFYEKTILFSYSFDNKNYSEWFNSITEVKNQIKEKINVENEFVVDRIENVYRVNFFGEYIILKENNQIIKEKEFNDVIVTYTFPKIENTNSIYIKNGVMYIKADYNINYYLMLLTRDNNINRIIKFNNDELLNKMNSDFVTDINRNIENIYILKYFHNNVINRDKLIYTYKYNDKLLFESHFSFYNTNNTYKNFVIYPRLLNSKQTQLEYWLNNKFRLRINVNDIWYDYEFELKIDELEINYAKLNYKYWSNNENWYSPFKQFDLFNYKSNNNEYLNVFNAYMYEPELVTINNSNFITDMKNFYINNSLMYIDGKKIPNNEFYYKIDFFYEDYRYTIYIHNNAIGQNIYGVVPIKQRNKSILSIYENIEFLENYSTITLILEEQGQNEIIDDSIYYLKEGHIYSNENYEENGDGEILIFNDDNDDDFWENNRLILLEWSDIDKGYYVGIKNTENRIFLPILQSFRTNNLNYSINNYTSYNIKFPDNYLNSIFLFDLYELSDVKRNIWNFGSYINNIFYGMIIKKNDNNDLNKNQFIIELTDGLKNSTLDNKEEYFRKYSDKITIKNNDKNVLTTRELEQINIWWNNVYRNDNDININNFEEYFNSDYKEINKEKYILYEYTNINNHSILFSVNNSIEQSYGVPIYDRDYNYIDINILEDENKFNIISFVNKTMKINNINLINKVIKCAREKNISNIKFNNHKLVYEYINELNEYVISNVKFKFIYYELEVDEVNNVINRKEKTSFTFNDYQNMYNMIITNKIEIYIRLYYEKTYNKFGIKREFNDYNDFYSYCQILLSDDEIVLDNSNAINLIYLFNKNNITDITSELINNENNLREFNKVNFNKYNCYKEYVVIEDKFGNELDVPQNYWFEYNDENDNENDKFYDLKNKLELNQNPSLLINWNDNTMSNISDIINKTLKYINKNNGDYRSYYKDYAELLINQYSYKNIFCTDITNIPGKYELDYNCLLNDIDDIDAVKMCAVILHNDDTINIYEDKGDIFYVKEDDRLVKVFLQFDYEYILNVLLNNDETNKISFNINLNKFNDQKFEKLKYEPLKYYQDKENIDDYIIECTFGDKTYYIDRNINNNQYICNLYKRFFELYYYNGENSLPSGMNKNTLYNRFYNQKVELNSMYLKYDTYLMHDYEYWYVIFISKDTIDKIDTKKRLYVSDYDDIIVPKNNENDRDMKLKFVKHDIQPMINRLIAEPVNEYKFDKNDIIVLNISNNKKLSFNPIISSKWNITNISLGKSKNINVTSNNEMCIFSTVNNNVYTPGYYDVDVRYTLTNNINKQYRQTSRFRINK